MSKSKPSDPSAEKKVRKSYTPDEQATRAQAVADRAAEKARVAAFKSTRAKLHGIVSEIPDAQLSEALNVLAVFKS